jgi:hypothetical protein
MLFAIIKSGIHIGNIRSENHKLALFQYLCDADINIERNIHKYEVILAKKYVHFN